ncbi:branched-chain amino acid ABC transporter permease [Flindersiella endophytica]
MRSVQALVTGLGLGSIYALLALGFVIIYKATRVISFAQPSLMVVGGLFAHYFTESFGLPFFAGLPVAMLATAGVGLAIERSVLRPMVGKPVFVLAIVTIGIDIVVRVVANRAIGVQAKVVRDPWGLSSFQVGEVFVRTQTIALIVLTAVIVGALAAFFRFTRTGLAIRATAIDQETALAQGVRVGAVFALSWALAGALAAVAGTFVAAGTGIEQTSWLIALKALPAIIIGGLDSLQGAVVGGLSVGVVEALVGTYQPALAPWLGSNFSLVAPYALMLLVLLVRPYGLFGTREVERV